MKTATRFALAALVLASVAAGPTVALAQEIQVSGGVSGDANVYIAEEGDTLWDVAERFFSDPWYWPTLWSFNPHITNPNWIFPGDIVYLTPPRPVIHKSEKLSITESLHTAGQPVEAVLGRRVGFISTDEYEGSGEITNSRLPREMLVREDDAYVRFSTAKRVKTGDLFVIYRVEGEITHPVTGDSLGFWIRYLGIAKVVNTDAALTKTVFVTTFEEVSRGDRVAPFAPTQRLVPPIRNNVALSGTLVKSFQDLHIIGKNWYVVVDKGTNDGVQVGNRFVLRQRGDGYEEKNPDSLDDFPQETYGELLVIEAGEKSSLAAVTYSAREFDVGAACDMLAGY